MGQDSCPLVLVLFRNVSNADTVRQMLLKGDLGLGLSLLKASLVPDPRLVQVAWFKAQLAQSRDAMTTRQMATEIVFNLSSSKNITDSLQKFGIGADDRDLLAVIFDPDPEAVKKKLLEVVEGEERDPSELSNLADTEKIFKYHKLKGSPLELSGEREPLVDLLISRVASKDIGF